jgi:hypothetical protein
LRGWDGLGWLYWYNWVGDYEITELCTFAVVCIDAYIAAILLSYDWPVVYACKCSSANIEVIEALPSPDGLVES